MFTRLFCLVHPLIDDDYDPNDPMKVSSSGRTAPPPQPLPAVPKIYTVPATLFEARVIIHGRVALIKAEAADLERQLASIPDNEPAQRFLRKRMENCKKIVADIESALYVIEASARHMQSKPLPCVLAPVSRLIDIEEDDLCKLAKSLEHALVRGDFCVGNEEEEEEVLDAEGDIDQATDQH